MEKRYLLLIKFKEGSPIREEFKSKQELIKYLPMIDDTVSSACYYDKLKTIKTEIK